MKTITVRLQGETDWINSIFKVEELNKLIDSSHPLPRIASSFGKLLDNNSTESIEDKREEVEDLLSIYVANLKMYQKMLNEEIHTLVITSFRSKGPRVGYSTRVAGAIRDHLNDMVAVSVDDPKTPIGDDIGYLLLLKLMASNPNYSKDKYHNRSIVYKILQHSKELGSRVDLRKTENPSNN